MHTYLIRYYDIAWGVHSATVTAESIQAAVAKLLAACTCTLGEIITYYETGE